MNKVKGYRNMLKLTQKQIAEKLDISTVAYIKKENGKSEFKDSEKIKFKELLLPYFPNITLEEIFSRKSKQKYFDGGVYLTNKNLTKEEERLLLLLKVGRKNIKTTNHLLNEMQIPNNHNGVRFFRGLIRSLRIKYKVPILSMREYRANGYFIAENIEEINHYTASIASQIKEERRMLIALSSNDLEGWKELLKGE